MRFRTKRSFGWLRFYFLIVAISLLFEFLIFEEPLSWYGIGKSFFITLLFTGTLAFIDARSP